MVDPANITNFNRTDWELEEFACFAILVAGKTAKTVAPRLGALLHNPYIQIGGSPLSYLGSFLGKEYLATGLKRHGFGCYNQKAETIISLYDHVYNHNYDLRTVAPVYLECIKGIGPKTSRFFILHSRENARVAALDTHILKGLRERLPVSISVPKSTPKAGSEYRRLENHFLHICDQMGRSPAEVDLEWWRLYSGN